MYATDKASRKTIWCRGSEDKYQRPACQIQNNHQRLGTLVTSGTSAGAENTQIKSKYKYKYNVWGHWSPKQKCCCCCWKVVFCASFRHPTRSVVVVWAEQCWALSAAFPHFTHPDAHLSASTAPIVSSDEWAHVASLNFFVSSLFELIFCHQSSTFELIYQHGPDSELRWVSSLNFVVSSFFELICFEVKFSLFATQFQLTCPLLSIVADIIDFCHWNFF